VAQFDLVGCQSTFDELDNVLRRSHIAEKYHITDEKRAVLLSTIREHAVLVPGHAVSGIVPADPKDDIFVACAIEGNAKYIVSGDRHLLDLKCYQTVRVVTAAYFVVALSRCKQIFQV
jgi:hypothetical protein